MHRITIADMKGQAEQISEITGIPHGIQNWGAGWVLYRGHEDDGGLEGLTSGMKPGELFAWMLAYKLGLVHGKRLKNSTAVTA